MDRGQSGTITYSILNPTGNITALVESAVEPPLQPAAAAEIMKLHPEVEQVGFMNAAPPEGSGVQAELRMAGGEFCGNATMCTAAMVLLRGNRPTAGGTSADGAWERIRIRVSGVSHPVKVCLKPLGEDSFSAGVMIPEATEIGKIDLTFQGAAGELPLVRMEGISHLIVEERSPFFRLRQNRGDAERAVQEWCGALSVSCLGLMFLERGEESVKLTPLVYVPESGTVFWENSCASGSAAVGMFLAWEKASPAEIGLNEPGGTLLVRSDPQKRETWLFGRTRYLATYTESVMH